MSDTLLRIGASWDWITPVITFIQNWLNRPSVGFNVSYGYGLSAWEMERFLKRKGIKVWGVMVIGDTITLRVRKAQALYTQYWLEQIGIPYQGGISPEAAEKYKRSKAGASKPSPEKSKGVGGIVDAINNMADRIG